MKGCSRVGTCEGLPWFKGAWGWGWNWAALRVRGWGWGCMGGAGAGTRPLGIGFFTVCEFFFFGYI